MDKKNARKIPAVLLSFAVVLPQLLSPAALRAQAEDAGAAAFEAPAMPGAGAAATVPSLRTIPSDLGTPLSANLEGLSLPANGAALGARAMEDAASLPAASRMQAAAQTGAAVSASNLTPLQATLPASAVSASPETASSVASKLSRSLAPPSRAAAPRSSERNGLLGRVARYAARKLALGTSLFDGSALKSPSLSPSAFSYGILRRRSKASLSLPPGVRVTKEIMPVAGQG
ncbi:MAG: hypothetical protein KGL04_09650, partial [Elusimicrobia bacterium]|nr:hypothetical protein [Elusimicrobiota bacterium]